MRPLELQRSLLRRVDPPSAHTHSTSQIVGLDTTLAGKAPVSHTHTKSQITDFAHGHAISEISGLQGELDKKQASGDYATNTDLTSGLSTENQGVRG